jgi:transcriptional regulator with XRE-family HTH domain
MERGFSLRHFQRIEAGRAVTLRTLWKLSQAFGVPLQELLPPPESRRSSEGA